MDGWVVESCALRSRLSQYNPSVIGKCEHLKPISAQKGKAEEGEPRNWVQTELDAPNSGNKGDFSSGNVN